MRAGKGGERGRRIGKAPLAVLQQSFLPRREFASARLFRLRQGLEYRNRVRPALYAHAIDLAAADVGHGGARVLADDDGDAVLLGQSLEPRCEGYRVAEHRVSLAEFRAHVADVHCAAVDADPDGELGPAALVE